MGADDAAARFTALGGRAVVDGALKDIFFRHGVADKFAIRLLHRHFDVADDEKVVHHGNVAMPWETNNLPFAIQDKIIPSSFVISAADKLFPYEFTYVEPDVAATVQYGTVLSDHAAFLREFNAVLKSTGLIEVLSLAVLEYLTGGIGMETTEGRANITVPLEAADSDDVDSIETVWLFDPKDPQQRGRCKLRCKMKGAHAKVHLYTKTAPGGPR